MATREVLTPVRFQDDVTFTGGTDLVLDTSTGTKIGTGTTQKLGFFNATPVAQQGGSVDLATVLSNLGLRATGGNPPLNLGSGALTTTGATTVGTLAVTDTITITNGKNIVVDTSTGTMIGTGTTQKLGFFGATPVAQQANSTDLVTVLSNLGFRATGGNPPLNVGSGAITTTGTLGAGASTLGATTATSLAATGAITSSGGALGYATGAGGTVTQATSRTTTVQLDTPCGRITLFTTTLAAATEQTFQLTNSFIAATDILVFQVVSGAAQKAGYNVTAVGGAGSASITIRNVHTATTASEAPVIRFAIIKGVNT